MQISVATANYYYLPFEQVLEIIAKAGFECIELDLYWELGQWAIAQHLKHVSPKEAVHLINSFELKVTSVHDSGGVVKEFNSSKGFINPLLAEYLAELGYAPGCIVFHTPHIAGSYDDRWWQSIKEEIVVSVEKYKGRETAITIENMPFLDSYYVPLSRPEELKEFTSANGIGVTLDTTHYAQIGIDIVEAARILRDEIKTIHLSDYKDGVSHIFIGDGELDFESFFKTVKSSNLHAITLECSAGHIEEEVQDLDQETMVNRLATAKERLQSILATA